MPNASRGSAQCALVQNQWVKLWQNMDYYMDAAYVYHRIGAHVEMSPRNTANVTILIQESETGLAGTWTRVWRSDPIVPGGHSDFAWNHNLAFVRILCYSTGVGVVDATRVMPELQSLPSDDRTALSCASFCEQDCETTGETTG